jgi:hypothetical protein
MPQLHPLVHTPNRATRAPSLAAAVLVLSASLASIAGAQGHGNPPADHAAMAMGFNQDSAVHHFHLYLDGGAIEVTARNPADSTTRAQIRAHLRHLAVMFANGDFSTPMAVHTPDPVPATAMLAEKRDAIRYVYHDVTSGGRVEITTTDPAALSALHEFLKFQIRAHRTGDPLAPGRR